MSKNLSSDKPTNSRELSPSSAAPVSALRMGGIVLCGGQSRRMGRSKAWLPWDGETLLERVVRVVSAEVQPVVLATRHGTALPKISGEVEFAFDRAGHAGPLAGIAAGFDALAGRCDAVFIVPCDHPFIRAEYIRRLIELLED